jgi:hypothetical protein
MITEDNKGDISESSDDPGQLIFLKQSSSLHLTLHILGDPQLIALRTFYNPEQ